LTVRLRMHRSGLSYIQTELSPYDVKYLVLLATEDGKVTDIVPVYKTKIHPDALTSLEDVQRLLKEGEDISVVIEVV